MPSINVGIEFDGEVWHQKRRIADIQKNFKAEDVISTSFGEKDPYPNNSFTISFDANINPKLAGIENRSESSNDLF